MTGRPFVARAHLDSTPSARGFTQYQALTGECAATVRVYESSSATTPRVWLNVIEPADRNDGALAAATGVPYTGRVNDATIELDVEQAWRLADQLRALVVNHYHADHRGELVPEWAADEIEQRVFAKLHQFHRDFAPDPFNDEPGHWAGSGADHAPVLYDILDIAGLHPDLPDQQPAEEDA